MTPKLVTSKSPMRNRTGYISTPPDGAPLGSRYVSAEFSSYRPSPCSSFRLLRKLRRVLEELPSRLLRAEVVRLALIRRFQRSRRIDHQSVHRIPLFVALLVAGVQS